MSALPLRELSETRAVSPPIEPPPTVWELPDPERAGEGQVAGVGADLEPGTLLAAYRAGLFPMRVRRRGRIGWWSPPERGVIPLDGVRVSRSLRRSRARFEVRLDTSFAAVIRACGDPARRDGWIDDEFVAAYTRLYELGWVHSVETWQDGTEPPGGSGSPPAGGGVDASRGRGGGSETGGNVTIMICPVSGLRATVNCPTKEAKTFRSGTEPKEFCTVHR